VLAGPHEPHLPLATHLPPDALVVGLALGASLAVAVLGASAHRAVRHRTLASAMIVVSLVGVGAVLAGALVTAAAMFLSAHDLRVLVLVAAVAGSVAAASAVWLSRGAVRSVRSLAASAATLTAEEVYVPVASPLAAELAAVDRALADSSARLGKARDRERALESSRRELVAWISHDLRTPLAGIRAMSEALEDGIAHDPEVVARYHRGIRTEADRLTGLVDDLFELSKINAGALRLQLHDLLLTDVVSDTLASAAPVAAAKGVQLSGRVAADLPMVAASAPELGRALSNLLSNAIRHTPAHGVVQLTADTVEGSSAGAPVVELCVQDACGGIPEDELPRLFDVAYRGTAARTPEDGGGAGLGLAIAQGLIAAHQGAISISNSALGCRVSMRLPGARPVSVQPAGQAP